MTEAIFTPFPKLTRYSRSAIVTEKIDGTNASVIIIEEGPGVPPDNGMLIAREDNFVMYAGSRTRLINPESDNYGFARWVFDHRTELFNLGAGRHFGEWWGSKIQRSYGLTNGDKRFSLFNVGRWALHGQTIAETKPDGSVKILEQLPACCGLVPVLARGEFGDDLIKHALVRLVGFGSLAAPGFMKPEGIVIRHEPSGTLFKKLIKNDELPKGLVAQ